MPEFAFVPGNSINAIAAATAAAIADHFGTDDIRTLAAFFSVLGSDLAVIAVQNEIRSGQPAQSP